MESSFVGNYNTFLQNDETLAFSFKLGPTGKLVYLSLYLQCYDNYVTIIIH